MSVQTLHTDGVDDVIGMSLTGMDVRPIEAPRTCLRIASISSCKMIYRAG